MSNVILRRDEVERRTGYKHTTIYKKMADGEFPPVHPPRGSRCRLGRKRG